MKTLRSTSTFNYTYNDIPIFRVSAFNLEGFGSGKENTVGAAIQTEPIAPSIAITNTVAETNDFQIRLNWGTMTTVA